MWITLIDKIKEKLDAHVGDGQVLVAAYASHNAQFSGFPVATFQPSDKEEDYKTTADNKGVYVFEIVVHQEMEQVGAEEAIRIVAAALDAIEADFRADYLLGGTVRLSRPLPVDWGVYPQGQGIVAYGTLKLRCEVDL